MPIYDYECRKCGVKYSDEVSVDHRHNPRTCPSCGDGKPVLLIGAPGFKIVDGNVGRIYESEAEIEAVHGERWREPQDPRS